MLARCAVMTLIVLGFLAAAIAQTLLIGGLVSGTPGGLRYLALLVMFGVAANAFVYIWADRRLATARRTPA
jgi:hypothetical protein